MISKASIEAIFRAEYGRVLATVMRTTRDFTLAEDAVSEALVAALRCWPADGVPERPVAWLTTVARRAAIHSHRRRETAAAKAEAVREAARERVAAVDPVEGLDGDAAIPDDRLRLIFTCSHPALAPETQIALTLQAICGLPAEEIARLLLVAPATLSQRLVRAKRKIKASGIAYAIPPPSRWVERLDAVLAVVYLLFTEGYAATRGDDLVRPPLIEEALFLARLLAELLPEEAEVLALLALIGLHDARRGARVGPGGELLPLDAQDRGRWDRAAIAESVAVLDRALALGREPGRYQIEAAIAALHAEAPTTQATDWPQIAALYAKLQELHPSPIVALNHAVAVAMVEGPGAGLERLQGLDAALGDHHRLAAVRGELLARAGRGAEARAALDRAIDLARNTAEVEHLRRRRAALSA